MIRTLSQPETTPRRLALSFLSSSALVLCGCQGISAISAPAPAQVRIIVASPNTPSVDLYAGGAPIAYNLAFGNVTSYIPLSPGAYTLSANATGTRQVIATATYSFGAAAQYTVLLGDVAANLQQVVLKDQVAAAPVGQIALRFLNQATAPGPVDVYLVPVGALVTSLPPVLTAQTFSANSGYLTLPAGAYRIVLYPTGAAPSTTPIPLYSGAILPYPAGAVRTLLLLDQRSPDPRIAEPRPHALPSLQIIAAPDVDPPASPM